jgi:hypothetical protein
MWSRNIGIGSPVQVLVAVMSAGRIAVAVAPVAQATSMVAAGQIAAAERSADPSANPERTRAEFQFSDDSWILYSGVQVEDELSSGENPTLTREQIQFFEDNWHLDATGLFEDEASTDEKSGSSPLNDEDCADSIEQNQEESQDAGDDSSDQDERTMKPPSGGDAQSP